MSTAFCAKLFQSSRNWSRVHANALLRLILEALKLLKPAAGYKIALTGGVLKSPSILNQKLKQKINELRLNFDYTRQEYSPAAAALMYALKTSGIAIDNFFQERLKQISFTNETA